jgi:hypothetical protein
MNDVRRVNEERRQARSQERRAREHPARPGSRRGPRANPPVERQEVEKGLEKLARVG